jgi:hypothetical protein
MLHDTLMTPADIVVQARRQLEALTGLPADTVSRFDRGESGWTLTMDMVEHRAIPRTNDLIAVFEVLLDDGGNLIHWHRTGRHLRNQSAESA